MPTSTNTLIGALFSIFYAKDFWISFLSNFFSALLVTGVLAFIAYFFTDIFRRSITVLVHEAYAENSERSKYYVKVTNVSSNKIFTITHAFVKDKNREIDLLNIQRPLPHKLGPSEQWETWFPCSQIMDKVGIYRNINVIMSNGKVFKSHKNKNVRPVGFVA